MTARHWTTIRTRTSRRASAEERTADEMVRRAREQGLRLASRLSELAGICYDPGDLRRSGVDLWQREITVRGKGGRDRIVRVGHQTARSLERYIRARSRHSQVRGACPY